MVGSISSSSMVTQQQASQGSNTSSSLTSSQLETITSTLEQFDGSNLSSDDASSIVEAFKEAGIQPSEELASAMEAEGFDAKEVGEMAGVSGPQGGGGMPPPPPPTGEEESSVSSLLDTLLSLEEDEDGTDTSSASNDVMEYTSRILNLNESSKTEVMDLLEKFSANEEEYTDDEVSNILKNSLSSILGDSENYNKVSFYA